MNKNVCSLQVLFDEFLGRVEKTFDVLRRVVSDQYPELLHRSVYLELRLSKDADNSSYVVHLQQLKVLSKQTVADSQSHRFRRGVGLDDPVEVGLWLVVLRISVTFLHIL